MGQMFGYVCSDDSLSGALMEEVGEVLRAVAPRARAGLGLGWVQGGRTLVRKHPGKRATGADLPALIGDLRSRAVVGHVRESAEGRVPTGALQPFRAGKWVWCQEGFGEASAEEYAALREWVPEHLRQRLGGRALAEVMFLASLGEVAPAWNRAGERERWEAAARAMCRVLWGARELLGGGDRGGAALVARGRGMVAVALGSPLWVRQVEGLAAVGGRRAEEVVERVGRERFRAVLVVSGPDPGVGWSCLGPGEVLRVEEGLELIRTPFEAMLPEH
ncbi:hypothetical protein DL240_09390 [Lujinxingia litoralis]|uniref:Uncharacterized protein n=1 Tax=Lujinxingia litoralis TaxID=2211119 RepID=A0A328C6E5_9DELT|nr:hypothetical protein [Lujinxingia litoralis]RAL23089.1 hypothetical protein DL240_09390 [Lujinxingia litoralis]